jgi:hypothetical protein
LFVLADEVSKSTSTVGKETFGMGTEKPKILNESKLGGSNDIFTDLRPYPFEIFLWQIHLVYEREIQLLC